MDKRSRDSSCVLVLDPALDVCVSIHAILYLGTLDFVETNAGSQRKAIEKRENADVT